MAEAEADMEVCAPTSETKAKAVKKRFEVKKVVTDINLTCLSTQKLV